MKILKTGTMKDGTDIQIEEWNEDYSFMPYGNTLATYPKSKVSQEGPYAPKANERYRFDFEFNSHEEAETAYNELIEGTKTLSDFKNQLRNMKYQDCI